MTDMEAKMCFSEEELDSYGENTAASELRKRIEQHLPSCKSCSEEVKAQQSVRNFLRQKPANDLPGPHPKYEEMEDFHYRRLDEARRHDLLKHLVACRSCRDFLEIIREVKLEEEGKVPSPFAIPQKLLPELEAYYVKYRIRTIAEAVIQKSLPQMQDFFKTVWEKIANLPELGMPQPKKYSLAGALGFTHLKPDSPESDILRIITTLEGSLPKAGEKEDKEKVLKKIRGIARKNKLKREIEDNLVESTEKFF